MGSWPVRSATPATSASSISSCMAAMRRPQQRFRTNRGASAAAGARRRGPARATSSSITRRSAVRASSAAGRSSRAWRRASGRAGSRSRTASSLDGEVIEEGPGGHVGPIGDGLDGHARPGRAPRPGGKRPRAAPGGWLASCAPGGRSPAVRSPDPPYTILHDWVKTHSVHDPGDEPSGARRGAGTLGRHVRDRCCPPTAVQPAGARSRGDLRRP